MDTEKEIAKLEKKLAKLKRKYIKEMVDNKYGTDVEVLKYECSHWDYIGSHLLSLKFEDQNLKITCYSEWGFDDERGWHFTIDGQEYLFGEDGSDISDSEYLNHGEECIHGDEAHSKLMSILPKFDKFTRKIECV